MSKSGHYHGGHTTFRVGDPNWGKVDKNSEARERCQAPPLRSPEECREFAQFVRAQTLEPPRLIKAADMGKLERWKAKRRAKTKGA